MTRLNRNILEAAMKTARSSLGSISLGKITFDSADDVLYKADGALTGVVVGIPVYRLASLDDGKYVYANLAGSTLASN